MRTASDVKPLNKSLKTGQHYNTKLEHFHRKLRNNEFLSYGEGVRREHKKKADDVRTR